MNPEPASHLLESGENTESDQRPTMEDNAKSEEGQTEDATGSALPNGSTQPPKRGRGRPLGSLNKRPKQVRIPGKRGRPRKPVDPSSPVKVPATGRKKGRPRKEVKRRGRPRKIPLTPEEEEERKKMKGKPKGPRVWKPLGRPRIYPRVDPPVPPVPAEPRGRGRPRKSRQGAHLRKNKPTPAPPAPRPPPADGLPRKRGRPPGSVKVKKDPSLSSPTSESDSEQKKSSPPPTKRSRRSSGKTDEFQEAKCPVKSDSTNKEKADEDAADGQNMGPTKPEPSASGDLTTSTGVTEDCQEEEGSHPVPNQRKRGRPKNLSGQATQEDAGEDESAARKHGSGRKTAAPKKTAVGKASRNGKPEKAKTLRGRLAKKNISSIL